MDQAVYYLPKVLLSAEAVVALRQGKTIRELSENGTQGSVRLYQNNADFIGLGDIDETGLLKVKRLLSIAE